MATCDGRTRPLAWALLTSALVASASYGDTAKMHHVDLTVSNAIEAAKWYQRHFDCTAIASRSDAVDCGRVEIAFSTGITTGGSPGTGIDHIGFSVPDLEEKMAEIEAVGVAGSGVRLQRFDDGSTFRDVPGLFKIAFVFDPWGTRIELVEDAETLGFHHVHLSSADPERALDWYRQELGGSVAKLRGRLDGLLFTGRDGSRVWLLASRHAEGTPATTEGRAIGHLGFEVTNLERVARDVVAGTASMLEKANRPERARAKAQRALLTGPDNVRVALVEPGWAGIEPELHYSDAAARVTADQRDSFSPPRTPWGDPDLQGVWTNNAAHGIPLERPEGADDKDTLTPQEAEARRERGTLGSIWGYEREWRDTTLGYVKSAPSTQVAMIIDPSDGRLPPMTENGKQIAAARGGRTDYVNNPPAGPEDLTPYVRCITRGLPGMMLPGIYNNGLQIVQSPGFVAIQKEMIHETRVVPTDARPPLGPRLASWLGSSRGRWDGDTLVVEVTNFNGKAAYRGSTENLKLTERFRRVGPDLLEYQFTVEDPTIWTRPWTARFTFEKDDSQYELVEYACHEGNYGMSNILSGARARDQQAAEATDQDGR